MLFHLDSHENEEEEEDVSPQVAKKPKKYPKILDGKFYTIHKEDGDNIVAICNSCTKLNTVNGTYSSTGNFRSHYKRIHFEKLDELDTYTMKKKSEKNHPNVMSSSSSSSDEAC